MEWALIAYLRRYLEEAAVAGRKKEKKSIKNPCEDIHYVSPSKYYANEKSKLMYRGLALQRLRL